MKVFYTGFNLYHQFTNSGSDIKDFTLYCLDDKNVRDIEVSHTYNVLLVADGFQLQGVKNEYFSNLALENRKIIHVSCNETLILMLTDTGELFKTYRNKIEYFEKVFLSGWESSDKIVKICCGAKLSIALSQKGNLYNLPNKLEFNSENIVDIKVGRLHCLLLDNIGNVYSFGCGSHGQLGHGNLQNLDEPQLIEALAGIRIEKIAAGGWHSVAISKDGDAYVWGWNSNGQLGLTTLKDGKTKPINVMATPQVIDFEFNVKNVACGNRHTILLLDNGHLYGCGWNKFNQIGRCKEENNYSLNFLYDFSTEKVKNLKCGPWSSVVICEKEIK